MSALCSRPLMSGVWNVQGSQEGSNLDHLSIGANPGLEDSRWKRFFPVLQISATGFTKASDRRSLTSGDLMYRTERYTVNWTIVRR